MADRAEDPAPLRCDLLLRRPPSAECKLVRTVSGEHHVRMRVNEPGEHHLSGGIEFGNSVRDVRWKGIHGTGPGNLPVETEQTCVLNNTDVPHGEAGSCRLPVRRDRDQLGDVPDEEVQGSLGFWKEVQR